MAKKRIGTKSALNNTQKPKREVSVWTPLFVEQVKEESVNSEVQEEQVATEKAKVNTKKARKTSQAETVVMTKARKKADKPEIDVSNETLKEIEVTMAERLYNKGEKVKNDDEDEASSKVFVTKAVPLANRGKKASLASQTKKEKVLSEKAEERKAKREAKKAAYKKTTFKHKLKVMGILSVLGIFTGSGLGVWYFNFSLKSNVDYSQAGNPDDYIQSVDDTLSRNFEGIDLTNAKAWVSYAQGMGKTPADLSPVDNFVLSQYNIVNANSYSVIGEGNISANTFGLVVDQFMYSEKKFDGEKYSFVSISPDTTGMVGDVAVCDVLAKGGNSIVSYKGEIIEGNRSANWAYNTTYSKDEHRAMNGVRVDDIQPYLICEETIVSSSEITMDEDGNYVFTLELDTIKAVLNYIKQVQRTGGLSSYPEFKSLQTTFTITPDWQLVKMKIVEVYKAVKIGVSPTITATINFDFTINEPIELPSLPDNG